MFLVYGGDKELVGKGYTDASFVTDPDDYKSQSGYVFILNGGAVSWKSSKQDTVAHSITEAEYMTAAEAAKEGVWMKDFITELGVVHLRRSIVTTMVPLPKQRNQGPTRRINMYHASFISYDSS